MVNWFCLAHGNVKLSFTVVTIKEFVCTVKCLMWRMRLKDAFRGRHFDIGGRQSSSVHNNLLRKLIGKLIGCKLWPSSSFSLDFNLSTGDKVAFLSPKS